MAWRWGSTAPIWSSTVRQALASVAAVSGVSELRKPISISRVAGSLKSAFGGAVGARCFR